MRPRLHPASFRPPAVSVIIPALDEGKYIASTLKSLRAQDYPRRFELIVADGNSEDNTAAIAKKFCDSVVIEPTRTIAAGRQAGVCASRGDILLFTDADSLADPHWVSSMVHAFDDPKVVAAFGMTEPREGNWLERFLLRYSVLVTASLLNWIGTDYVTGSNMALRRSAYDQIGGFNIYLVTGEDTDVIHRAHSQGKVVFVSDSVVRYSMRRIRRWGYPKYLWFHFRNFFKTFIFKKPAQHYEQVR